MLRVLIVDDNPGFIAVLRELLKQYSQVLQVDSAHNAADGQLAVAKRPPDLVFIDIKMPGTNGFELTARLRQVHPLLRIILVSLSEHEQYQQHALEAGASGFVAKGHLFAELPKIIADATAASAPARADEAESLRHLTAVDLLGPSTEAALIVDGSGFIVYANARLLTLFGYEQAELIAQPIEILVPQQLRATHRERRLSHQHHYRTHAMATDLNVDGRRKDGTTLPLLIRLNTLDTQGSPLTVAFVSDLGDQSSQRSELERLNRSVLMLHDCKLLVERSATESALLDGICRRLAEFGPYPRVRVGLTATADAVRIEFMASSHGSPDELAATSPSHLGEGIPGRSIRNGQPLVERASANSTETASLAIPFAVESQRGCLCIDAARVDAFSAREIELLQKVTDDLAYGLTGLRIRAARTQAEARLRLLERAVESSANAVIVSDAIAADHPILYVNPAFEQLSGHKASEVLGRNGRFMLDTGRTQSGMDEIRAAFRGRRKGQASVHLLRKDGSNFWSDLSIAPVPDDQGRVTHFIAQIKDLTEFQRQQAQIEQNTNYDALTGLPNRFLLFDRLRQAVAGAIDQGREIALLLIDIDRLALINDAYGYDTGDLLLRLMGKRLQETLHPKDTISRVDGDEFAALCVELANPDDSLLVADKIRAGLAAPFILPCGELTISASIGISLCPRDSTDAETLLNHAAAATQRAKNDGRGQTRFYAEAMHLRTRDRLEMEQHLRHALENREFEAYYQPIIDAQSGRIVEAEALLRWHHPQHGLVPPDQFIPLAEETGMIVPIGAWMLGQACRQNAAWRAAGLGPITVGVNLSARQFHEPGLAACIAAALADSGLEGDALVLEVTESLLMANIEDSAQMLRRLKLLGIQISLDDFGTGYSSFAYLRQLPLDSLKIDRSFVRDLHTDATDAAIAQCIIVMARAIGLGVIAEGVETKAQMSYLRGNGCHRVQGYLFSRPVTADKLALMLQQSDRLAKQPARINDAISRTDRRRE